MGGGPEGRCVVPVDTGVMMRRGVLSCARSEQGGMQGVVVVVWSQERELMSQPTRLRHKTNSVKAY